MPATTDDLARRLDDRVALAEGPKHQRLARAPVRMAVTKLAGRRRVRAKTFWGGTMEVQLPEPLSFQVYRYGYFEEGLSHFLLGRLRGGMTFFDVGAHFGYFTLLAAKLVGPDGIVHSFEPTPSTFGVLRKNAEGLSNVAIHETAVWSHPDELELRDFGVELSMFNSLYDPRISGEIPHRMVKVPAISLDDHVEATGAVPDFVKVDAESAEAQVLEGMRRTIEAHGPAITLEVGDMTATSSRSRELLDSVVALGYSPYEFAEGVVRPHALRDHYEYDNILLVR
jgi:FkbM family methyltransferase